MDYHTAFQVLFYGFLIIFYGWRTFEERRQEKKLAETLDKLDKFIDKQKFLDK